MKERKKTKVEGIAKTWQQEGFTLIELLIVIGIIGMLTLANKDNMATFPLLGGFGLFMGCLVGAGTFSKLIEGPITRKVTGVKDTRTLT